MFSLCNSYVVVFFLAAPFRGHHRERAPRKGLSTALHPTSFLMQPGLEPAVSGLHYHSTDHCNTSLCNLYNKKKTIDTFLFNILLVSLSK